jgi:hypothetical protein
MFCCLAHYGFNVNLKMFSTQANNGGVD